MKTSFTKDTLHKRGQWLFLDSDLYKSEFIARFKYNGPVTMAKFIKQLIKNHTVEEYLLALNNPDFSKRKAPLEILREKDPDWYYDIINKWKAKH